MPPVEWILLVEDEADHRILVREALDRVKSSILLHEVANGAEAIGWLQKRVANGEPLEGGLVVLDLGMPFASGFEVLEWMRAVPALARTPAVVLTASENPMDADHAFNLGARGYFQKPADFHRYLEIFQSVFEVTNDAGRGGASS
jgi:CheY-like chemotaxis protein